MELALLELVEKEKGKSWDVPFVL